MAENSKTLPGSREEELKKLSTISLLRSILPNGVFEGEEIQKRMFRFLDDRLQFPIHNQLLAPTLCSSKEEAMDSNCLRNASTNSSSEPWEEASFFRCSS